MSRYFDVHSHIAEKDFDHDRDQMIARMNDAGVSTITVGVDYESSRRAVALAADHDSVYASIGLHPTDTPNESFDSQAFENLVQEKKVVAVGECGLDYNRDENQVVSIKETQKKRFIEQIEFALEYEKPLMIHARPAKGSMDAYEDVLQILESRYREVGERLRGNVHFFVGNVAIAKRFYMLGFSTSFTGVITFTRDYDEVVRYAPTDRILAETDAPYAAPIPHRGKRNEPLFVIEVVKKIAELRNRSLNEVTTQLRTNTEGIFGV